MNTSSNADFPKVSVTKQVSCVICGKKFEAKGSQTTCQGPHYKTCAVCGTPFVYKHLSDKRKTCSRKCWSQLRKNNLAKVEHTCEYCGKKFFSTGNKVRFCEGPHFRKCVICGKEFEIDLHKDTTMKSLAKTCSPECTQKLTVQTNLEKYGVPHASQTPEARENNRKKAIENQEEVKQINMERYGYPYAVQHPDIRKRLSAKTLDPEVKAKTRTTTLERYGVEYAMQSAEVAKRHSRSQFAQTAIDGTKVDSAWERDVYNFFLRNGIEFEYNTYSIPYVYDGSNHVTHIDFKVGDLLFEVKGSHLMDGAWSDDPRNVPIDVKLAVYRKHHVVVITDDMCRDYFGKPNSTESNGLKYLNKCPEPLIGVDIALFNNPQFPFASDRPKCFYKVKVDGSPCSFEAFYNDQTRWKMIVNRINYSGGFIDAKQVLTAMNVTRTCKQPSWFAKSLAKRIISEYCTSSVIVDPFAGWGTRHDAAIELKRQYVGGDFNPELVKWHKSKHRNVELSDATKFEFENDCSVFICPPYSDPATGRCFEDYNFSGFDASAKSLSQCDWLKIVMNNVPRAKEYVMVCKILDEGFSRFVVETLENSSHFGKNHEYVLVIPQSKREEVLNRMSER